MSTTLARAHGFGPATVVLVDRTPYLIDAGVGVIRRWAAAVRKYDLGLAPWDLRTAFFTHLHSDHTLGYPDLIFTAWNPRERCPSCFRIPDAPAASRVRPHWRACDDGPRPGGICRRHPHSDRRGWRKRQRDANEAGARVIQAQYGGRVVVANDLDLFQ